MDNTNTINTWAELKKVLKSELDHNNFQGTKLVNKIRTQGIEGDLDWLIDILGEVEYIKPGDTFFIEGFHDTLKKYKLNIEGIDESYRYIINLQLKQ